MDKQKQIEEMTRIMKSVKYEPFNDGIPTYSVGNQMQDFVFDLIGEALYNAGYRKIPEGAVILTKAEYESKRLLAKECLRWRWKYGNMNAITEESNEENLL